MHHFLMELESIMLTCGILETGEAGWLSCQEHTTLDLGVISLSHMLGVEIS